MLRIPVAFRRTAAVAVSHVWFAERPKPADASRFTRYFHCKCTEAVTGFTRTAKFTKLVNIERTDEDIQKDFRKSTQYEVRRAQKEGLTFGRVDSPEVFSAFYAAFAVTKDQPVLHPPTLCGYWPNLIVTQMSYGTDVLVMHGYTVDPSIRRATLWRSASLFRDADGEDAQQRRQLIGRANRLLHFADMTWLRDQGFKTYDFGGYAANTSDPALQRINEFKDNFGGELVEESEYVSIAMTLLSKVKTRLPRLPVSGAR